MKATLNQIKLAKEISDYILSIVTTNDLSSPSHWSLNEEYARTISEEYNIDQLKELVTIPNKDNLQDALRESLKETFDWEITTIRRIK